MAISRLSKVLNNFNKTLDKIEKNYKILSEHLSNFWQIKIICLKIHKYAM
jgi:hypothetical protein